MSLIYWTSTTGCNSSAVVYNHGGTSWVTGPTSFDSLALDDLNRAVYSRIGGHPMTQSDKTLTCVECGAGFTFTAGEQEFFAARGYTNEPKRCPACRDARRGQQGGVRQGGVREMYPAVCAECGSETTVPFRPRGDRPVYCSDCFSRMRDTSPRSF